MPPDWDQDPKSCDAVSRNLWHSPGPGAQRELDVYLPCWQSQPSPHYRQDVRKETLPMDWQLHPNPYLSSQRHRFHWSSQIDFLPSVESEIRGCDPLQSKARCPPYVPTALARRWPHPWSHDRSERLEFRFFWP